MADGDFTVKLDAATAARVARAAREAGVTPEAWTAQWLADTLSSDHDWEEADRRLAEYDRTGKFMSLEDAMQSFERAVEAKLIARR